MIELKTDRELLRDYAESASGPAFQSLVQRHVDLVFATALRGVSDSAIAQELTQNVFITLARKAAWLQSETSVAGWLHKTALYEVRHWWRGELRRQLREQTAAELGTTMNNEDSLLKALAGELDDGLLALSDSDRQALMLRYFEGRSHREIGTLLGAREDTVRMRINKALDRLTQFFRKRGYAVPAVATTAAALSASAKAAPDGFAAVAASSALTASSPAAATGTKLLLIKFMGLTKTQTALVCAVIAAAPVAWEWNASRAAAEQAAATQTKLTAAREQQTQSAEDLARLRSESTQLDATLADAAANESRYAAAAQKLDALKARVHALLAGGDGHWPGDLPYVRVHKSTVKALDLLHKPPMAFGGNGTINQEAVDLFGITAEEKGPAEQALAGYMHGLDTLYDSNAYETNVAGAQPPGRQIKTVIIPPLGQPLKDLGANTAAQLTSVLGADREQMLFGDWAEGGIQLFSPGNVWKISEQPQTLSVWIDPPGADGTSKFGTGRSCADGGGMSGEGRWSLAILPGTIREKFFNPWLAQNGVDYSTPR
jgi:RNA polymerase sigma factor (sigma-70 family)